MKPEDKDKLNECLKILDTTDLGLGVAVDMVHNQELYGG